MLAAARFLNALALVALLTVAALGNGPAAAAHATFDGPAPKPLPFQPDEELIYQADFSKLMLRGIEIAEFRFTVTRGQSAAQASPAEAAAAAARQQPGNLVYKGDVRAKGWFRKIFGIDFHYNHESTVAPGSLLILHTSKLDEQGKRVRVSDAVFDRATNVVTWTERNPNDPNATPRVVRNVLDGAAHDFISAIYFLRTQPLKAGQSFELIVSDSGQTVRVPVRVGERKTIKTIVGRVATLPVEIGIFGAGRLINDREGKMTLWITDDARRLPVRARLNADIGTLDIKLRKVSKAATGAG